MENDKLVRLSDVIETVENQCSYGNMWGNENLTLIDAYNTVDELSDLPAVDAAEVVRCRECVNSRIWSDPRYRFCERWRSRWNPTEPMLVDDENYCSWGQRREDGDV